MQSQYNLGMEYYFNSDMINAFQWLLKAAMQGYTEAQLQVALMYDYGNMLEIEKDPVKAIEWYEKAAYQNNEYAQYRLGEMYLDGEGGQQNYDKAVEWLQKAAQQGYLVLNISLVTYIIMVEECLKISIKHLAGLKKLQKMGTQMLNM
ncbi:tetratricopeptide repeat protein [Neisseria sp. Ec49-e6-T10]|uniref:tetratricopeptide repeat protein n=1 Tax=Neisseria sp. Ec49-e6-T10 TaxID=3140744 RepID=UPI003EB9B841